MGQNHSHTHTGLCFVRSSVSAQLFNKKEVIQDSSDVLKAKELVKQSPSEDNFMQLAKALSLQLRYLEVIQCCKEALLLYPESFKLRRMLAIRYLTTTQIEKAYVIFNDLKKESQDLLDINYRLSLCLFYQGKYQEAKKLFYETFSYCQDQPEMYIANLYWYLFCIVKLKEDITDALDLYYPMEVGHHVGYLLAIQLFQGENIEKLNELSKSDNLTRIMFLFGLYHYYLWKDDKKMAKMTFDETLKCDEYWASFAGIGAWCIYFKQKKTI